MAESTGYHTRVRRMRERDLGDVLRVERSAYEFPWSERVFRDCLRVGYSCWLITSPAPIRADVFGFAVMSMGAGEAHVLNLCIDAARHRAGLGRRMLGHLMEVAANSGVQRMLLEVRPSNLAAVRLYERAGFDRIGTRKGYYPSNEGREDATVMALDVSQSTAAVSAS